MRLDPAPVLPQTLETRHHVHHAKAVDVRHERITTVILAIKDIGNSITVAVANLAEI